VGQGGFPRAGFTDDAKGLPLGYFDRYVPDGMKNWLCSKDAIAWKPE
jgi:hypothetical protein